MNQLVLGERAKRLDPPPPAYQESSSVFDKTPEGQREREREREKERGKEREREKEREQKRERER